MKNIRFDFTCSRQVPFYAHLCNEFLNKAAQNYPHLNLCIGLEQQAFGPFTYFIEALGEQNELEQLADAIAADFPISLWLTDSRIRVIETSTGQQTLLDTGYNQGLSSIPFCPQCYPQLGDNQSPRFGVLSLECPCCHGERQLGPEQKALTLSDIQAMAARLISQGELDLSLTEGLKVSLTPIRSQNEAQSAARPRLLICNPNTLNAHFCVNDEQVLALSSIEKPLICVRPIQDHDRLTLPLYDIGFAHNRMVLVLAELLRQKGIDWLYLTATKSSSDALRPQVTWIDGAFAQINAALQSQFCIQSNDEGKGKQAQPLASFNAPEPLRDGLSLLGYQARWQAHKKSAHLGLLSVTTSSHATSLDEVLNRYHSKEDHTLADAALYAALLDGQMSRQQGAKHAVIIYLSRTFPSQIVSLDGKGETELFFALPELPDNGYEIFHQLETGPQKAIAQKFKSLFPDDYLALLSLKLNGRRDNLQSLWAIAAILIGLNPKDAKLAPNTLSDALNAAAMRYHGSNAPRIDYPLTKGEAHRSLNWCKTLGTVLSFRVAGHSDPTQLAFAMHDSLADYLANWMEHLDLNLGVQQIALAGSEFENEVLCKRIGLRLGKNFPLLINRCLSLEGDNLAVGALYVKNRSLNALA
ncbi:Kae1-like domain-containing protein [Shewanella acanthi]|uniref:Kae1-like domain-containing protein n=1 Tax=Shewanella acanthi TaxID=2864212 RepID=UPI001C65C411|nr:NiFe hydrogenase [Shewanella acanthi]QYJ80290.1 NiFe hydrogenase [Shewanella acanthi]